MKISISPLRVDCAMDAIVIEGLRYRYPNGNEALKGISLRIGVGESVAIVGPNGAGKTTLLLHLNGILRGEGKVFVFGDEVNGENLPRVRRRVGLVFQDPDDQLFMPTVIEDIAFGLLNIGCSRDEAIERAMNALRQVGMEGAAYRSPHQLSLGERKRIAIATVLAMHPDIMVLDEPMSNLDPRSRRSLISLLQSLNVTKVIATHDLDSAVQLCTRVIVMDNGEIVADGEPAAILGDKELMEAHGLETPLRLLVT